METITLLFPGSDIAPTPADALWKISGITHTAGDQRIRSKEVYPESLLVVRVPDDTVVHDLAVTFLVAATVENIVPHTTCRGRSCGVVCA